MGMNDLRGCRPFPADEERKERCMAVLRSRGMSVPELAAIMGVSRQLIHAVISGRQLDPATETRIAGLFGLPRSAMFPPRTAAEIAYMREAERNEKARVSRLRAERAKAVEEASEGAA